MNACRRSQVTKSHVEKSLMVLKPELLRLLIVCERPLQVRLPLRSVREQEHKPGIKIQFSVGYMLGGIWDNGVGVLAAF